MNEITVGVLTVSDRCYRQEAIDESGPNLTKMIGEGIIQNGRVVKVALVSDCKEDIEKVMVDWCDEGIHLILTTGGTGIAERDVTPEATAEIAKKTVPGIASLMFQRSSEVTPFAALSRGIAGIRGKTLIVNLPGSKKASRECLESVACVIPHAIDLLMENVRSAERVHVEMGEKKSSVVVDSPGERRRESAYPCILVSEAQKMVMENVGLLIKHKEKMVCYKKGRGYVLAEDVTARDCLPPFDASLKDGYAVLSSDETFERDLIGVSGAGEPLLDVRVIPGCCVRVSTGAAIPPGADAVVQVEDTEVISVSDDHKEEKKITLKKLPCKGQDIRPMGFDFKVDQVLLTSGTYLDAAAIGLLAAAGVTFVKVFDKPVVGVLSTGNELVPPEERVPPGKVRDSNRITLMSLLWEENFEAVDLGIAPDNPGALRDSLERGFRTADVVVTTGSMSMGERDYLKEVLVADFNAKICFGRVLMKPGKPTSFGVVTFEGKTKLWFGLPGNPSSALVTSQLFLLPALRKISGYRKIFPISVRAEVDRWVPLEDRPQYVRGILTYNEITNSWSASVNGNQSSSRIESCVNANCLLAFPKETEPTQESKPAEANSSTPRRGSSFQTASEGSDKSKSTSAADFSGVKSNWDQNLESDAAPVFVKDANGFTYAKNVKALLISKSYFRA